MPELLFDLGPQPALPVLGEARIFPIRRIFCVGRNYASHAAEMGSEVDRKAPWYFTKSAHSMMPSGAVLPYPPGTGNFHHEVELVAAIGAPAFRVPADRADAAVFGYGTGLDMTRRDLQQAAKDNRRPWSLGKDLEGGAVLGALTRASDVAAIGPQRVHLAVNGTRRQDGLLSDQVWSVAEIIADLSRFYHLGPGDLIMTGTPAGVGPVEPGDRLLGQIDGLEAVAVTIGPAE